MTIRWGIIGCGDIVRKRVAAAIRDDAQSELVAACRANRDAIEPFCREYGIARAYASAEDLMADRELDAVYIATPVHLHLPQTLAAAAAGKHVLVEKPMAMNTAECEQMIAGCRERGVRLGVAYYRNFYPIVARMRELVESGEIGKPLSVFAVCSTPFAIAPGEEGYWRVLPEEGGGGALMDIGSHRINLMQSLLGEIRDVKAICSTVAADYPAEDSASLALRFASGMHGSLQCFFGTPIDPDIFSIFGTKGRVTAAPLNGPPLQIETAAGSRTEQHLPPANLHAPLIADFTSAIRERREPLVTGEQGRAVNEVMERAYQDAARS